jgi:hypothetical protein
MQEHNKTLNKLSTNGRFKNTNINIITPTFEFDKFNIGPKDILLDAVKLSKKTTESNLSDIEKLAKSCIVDFSKQLQPPPVAMEIKVNGKTTTLFTKGNFSIITGKAKSRKSFLVSILMATAIKGDFQDFLFCPKGGINILFDTEQAEHKVNQISKRICHLSGNNQPDNFLAFHLRGLEPIQRIEVINHILSETPNINIVAIDGIIDLAIDPILQADQAQMVISKLMKWMRLLLP